ncbi:excalibur calcium-binding domain-containing protein [Arthrobacter sp. 260]|uniref:excalibur calcium-binding domain-containing protein n=1 Tax=Arthrobacter sp. 260 TaxID=2735314 RepID=UPI001490A088|nr:excalibur calcium-binding domain-containing protein [Arthrobacter sp. 260]NOJ59958.1 excalibur calcium-binding domain-containing protein [Arthrobacter sp. 260]
MKKRTAGLSVAVAVGFTALSATPALAVALPFENCDAAAAVGVYNIPAGTPGYQLKLDADKDGFGCDAQGNPAYNASIVDALVVQNTPPVDEVVEAPVVQVPAVPVPAQVQEMPVGGAETGVAQQPGTDVGALALGGGLVLTAALGGAYLVRRAAIQS